jgi:hypothetical protein
VGAPEILGQPNPQFVPELAQKFRELMQKESDRFHHQALRRENRTVADGGCAGSQR